MAKQIMLVVGEASGDIHGANLVRALYGREPALKVFGVAGEQLRQTNFEALFNVSKLTGMGVVELIGNSKNIVQAFATLRRALRDRRPDLLILIDFPDFNLRLARRAKALSIPVLYYISPQIWAWRQSRIRQIARYVDQMAVVFPFEEEFYRKHGVQAVYVGHPLLETVRASESREAVLERYGLDPAKLTVALLPGSRHGEIRRHLGVMREAARRLQGERAVQFLCVCASTIDAGALGAALGSSEVRIPVISEGRYNAMHAADLLWTASGTATLETALLGRPMIIVYRLSWATYGLARLLVRVKHIGMVNLIAGERIVPELVQGEVNPDRIVAESRLLLDDPVLRSTVAQKLARLRERLGEPGAADRVADLALGMLATKAVKL